MNNLTRSALVCLIILLPVSAFGIGYTVFVRETVYPIWLTLTGSNGSIDVLNPGETPIYPPTFRTKICHSQPFSIYSSAIGRRTEVWEDYKGTATMQDIKNACPDWLFSNSSLPPDGTVK